jgi:activator of 2-hydroxyglutaryl-CoA dehydratase
VQITTTCIVFGKSEILSWLARGKKVEDILMGVHRSIAVRSMGLLRRVGVEPQVTFTGGVSRNRGMVEVVQEMLGVTLNVSEESQFMGALGAALFALDHIRKSRTATKPPVGKSLGAKEGTAPA